MTKTNITLSAYQLVVKMDEGSLTFDNIIQRGPAWDSDRDSLLINSMLIGYPIPAFYMERGDVIQIPKKSGVRKLDCWDGYQRSHAIYRYMKNEYPLSVHELVDGNDYYGYTYEKLPDDLQETIKNYQFLVYLFEDTTFSEITEMFFRLNNGKPLTNIEIVRTRIKDLSNIRSLAQHEFFEVA